MSWRMSNQRFIQVTETWSNKWHGVTQFDDSVPLKSIELRCMASGQWEFKKWPSLLVPWNCPLVERSGSDLKSLTHMEHLLLSRERHFVQGRAANTNAP